VRKTRCLPMIALCLLLVACGGEKESEQAGAAQMRSPYMAMEGCRMEAQLSCGEGEQLWQARVQCDYTPEESVVEILAPEEILGVRARLREDGVNLEYEDLCLNIGTLSRENISPMTGLPQMMEALRVGWLLEENREEWDEIPCLRLSLDQTGEQGSKIVSTVWLREEDGTPVRGEIAVDGENILTVEFTSFVFYGTMQSDTDDMVRQF